MIYSIDASSLIETYEKKYPPDIFESLWQRMDGLVESGQLKISEIVADELGSRSDGVRSWVDQHDRMIVPLDEAQQVAVREIQLRYPKLVDHNRSKSGGDPFLIALAKVNSGVVVTEDFRQRRDRPIVPDVCSGFEIGCTSFLGLLKRENWVFR